MFRILRTYWVLSRGHRLAPWRSPYLRWRLETYFGIPADKVSAGVFLTLMWRERGRMAEFLRWAEERQREQSRR